MQLSIKFADFLFVIDSFDRSGRDCAVKRTRTVENTGEFQAKRNTSVHRPNERPDCESNESTLDRVDHTKPRHVPWFPLASENQNDRSRDARRRESGVNRGEIAEETAKEKQNDARSQRSSSQRGDQQRGGNGAASRADRAVQRGFPGSAEIGLRDDQRREYRPVPLVEVPLRIDCIRNGAGEADLDSLLDRWRFTRPEGRLKRNGSGGQWQRRVCRRHERDYIRDPVERSRTGLRDPAAAHDDLAVVKHSGLSGSDGPLRLIEGD